MPHTPESHSPKALNKKAMDIMGSIGMIQTVLAVFNDLKNADINNNGEPDWLDFLKLAKACFAAVEKFKTDAVTFTVGDAIPNSLAFFGELQGLAEQAKEIIGDDVAAFKAKYPDMFHNLD